MPKNVCKVLNNVLFCLLALVMLPVHFQQSPSGKDASLSLSAPKPNQSNPLVCTKQNTKTLIQESGLMQIISSQVDYDKLSLLQKQYNSAQIFSLF